MALTSPAQAQDARYATAAWWKKCTAIRDDKTRLACFDNSAPADPPARSWYAPPQPAVRAVAASNTAPVRDMTPSRRPRQIGYRVAIGYGLGVGSHAGSFEVNHGSLTSTAGIGSDGDTLTAQLWIDRWIARDWSLGFEYLYINNIGKLSLTLPNGVAVLTDPVNAHSNLNAYGHLGFVNVAYRPETGSILRPYFGTGLGVGYGVTNADLGADNAFVGSYRYTQRGATLFGALQGFMGVDVAMGPHYYASTFAKAVWMPGHPFFKIHQRYLDVVLGGGIGRKF